MKKTLYITLSASVALAAAMGSCADDREALSAGQGRVYISTAVNTDVKVQSRAETEADLAEKCMVWISKTDKGLVRRYDSLSEMPADGISLSAGSYVAEAWTGDSVPASWDQRWFKGYQPFSVEANATARVEVVCKVANVVASVSYSDEARQVIKDYVMTVGHSHASLDFEGDTDAKGYFMMPSTDKDLEWTLSAKLHDGSTYTRSGVIENAVPATWYKLNVGYTFDDSEIGGGYLTIEVDDTEDLNEDTIVISVAPDITGYGFDIEQPLYAERGKLGRRSLFVIGSEPLTSVVVECDGLAGWLGIDGNDFDAIKMQPEVAEQVRAGGISITSDFPEAEAGTMMKISLEESFTALLEDGEHVFTFTATDAKGKTSHASMRVIISDVAVVTNPVNEADVWAKRATVTGTQAKADATGVRFIYRRAGDTVWSEAGYTVDGKTLTATLSDLEPATTYEYALVCDQLPDVTPLTFTTEAATQLPNAGFEQSQQITSPESGKSIWDFNDGAAFWDTGNHGSCTIGANVTEPTSDICHSGSKAVSLNSQFVGVGIFGKFAAGNIFAGEYLKTNGMNGVLGWGRAFTSRPETLRAYVKYTPKDINYVGDGTPAGISKGNPDQGIIYVALLDGSQMGTYNGKTYPVIVNTATQEVFDRTKRSDVVAYGECVLTEAHSGMVEVNIPIEYVRTDVKPRYIVLVASSSRYGDFFTGGPSQLILDDLELIY